MRHEATNINCLPSPAICSLFLAFHSMISVITAIHNGLPMNKIFWEYLERYTAHPYELIIVDNNSTDGSREFFESKNAVVIRNEKNYSYPYCQNQGIRQARYDIFAFLNNDIIVAPQWDKHLLDIAGMHGLEILSPSGIERQETVAGTRRIRRKWNAIKNLVSVFGRNERQLKWMHRLMYGSWESYCSRRMQRYDGRVGEGFVGNTVVMKRSALEKVGWWDEQIQAADFDLYIRSKRRNLEQGDIKPMHIAWGVFNHHYIRLTVKSKPPEFADKSRMISLDEKWGNQKDFYLKDIDV